MKLTDYVAEYLSKKVGHVFCGNGGVVVHLLDSISRREEEIGDIELIPMQHEQSASIAAEAYARIHGFGVAIATSGPGFVNIIQGMACAYFDSIPVLYIVGSCPTGHQNKGQARQQGFQEIDVCGMVKSITKLSFRLDDPSAIGRLIDMLCEVAITGRPGPVLLEVPDDFQRWDGNVCHFLPHEIDPVKVNSPVLAYAQAIHEMLMKAQCPLVIVGGGVKIGRAQKLANDFLYKSEIPYVCTWATKDTVASFYNSCIGTFGINGPIHANEIVQDADLIISFGCKLDTHQTGGNPRSFAPKAQIVAIDIDCAELEKENGRIINLKVCVDLNDLLLALNFLDYSALVENIAAWRGYISGICENQTYVIPEAQEKTRAVNPYYFMKRLARYCANDAVIVTDAGATLTWTMQAFQPKPGQQLFSAFNHSPMGYALPAAIGAYYATHGEREIICIIGDGGFAMCHTELTTVKQKNIPLKMFVLDNKGYGIMRQTQDTWLEGRHTAIDSDSGLPMPPIWPLCVAHGLIPETIVGFAVDSQMVKFFAPITILPEKALIGIVSIANDAQIKPKLIFGKSIGDME